MTTDEKIDAELLETIQLVGNLRAELAAREHRRSTNPDQSVEDAAGEAAAVPVHGQSYDAAKGIRCVREDIACRECNAEDVCDAWEAQYDAVAKERDEYKELSERWSNKAETWRKNAVASDKRIDEQATVIEKSKAAHLAIQTRSNELQADLLIARFTGDRQATLIDALREVIDLKGWFGITAQVQFASHEKVQAAERALDGTGDTTDGEPDKKYGGKMITVSEERYNAVVTRAEGAESTAQSLRNDLDRLNPHCATLETQLDAMTAERDGLSVALDAAERTIRVVEGTRDKLAEDLAKMTTKKDQHLQWYNDKTNAYQLQSAHVDELGAKIATANATIARLVTEQEAKP